LAGIGIPNAPKAIKDIYEDVRSIAEPAGALATAGLSPLLSATPTKIRA
jgi:threonine dehydratase